MNKVILMGRLTRNPEIYNTGDEQRIVAKYTLAVGRLIKREGEENVDFINCTAFSNNARFAEAHFRQGTKIVITGRLQTGSYTDKEGKKVYTTAVIIETQEFAESKVVEEEKQEKKQEKNQEKNQEKKGKAPSRKNQKKKSVAKGVSEDENGFLQLEDGAETEI